MKKKSVALVKPGSFSPDRLAQLAQQEKWHFWFIGRRRLVEQLLGELLPSTPQNILDLGCGTGFFVEQLSRRGHQVTGIDLHVEGLRVTRQKCPEAALVQADALHLPVKQKSIDAVLLLDVMEHVNDEALLAGVQKVLRPEGILVVMVPAFPWLWSYRDKGAGHLRRYRQKELERVLNDAGFLILETRFYQFWLMPLLMISRLMGKRGPTVRDFEDRPRPFLNSLFTKINVAEVRWGEKIDWPWGSSLIAACIKG